MIGSAGRALSTLGVLALATLFLGCGSDAARPADGVAPADSLIAFLPDGDGWTAELISSDLDEVSNNGFGYTGDIDRFEVVPPADGRLQVALIWHHAADFDLLISSDPFGQEIIAESSEGSNLPEYAGVDVEEGRTVWVLVAGWTGDPGDYTLETVFLPPDEPIFALQDSPSFFGPSPRNLPLTFRFNKPLDPDQEPGDRIFLIATGHVAVGSWCVDGDLLHFLPHLPEFAGDDGGLLEGLEYTIQMPRGPIGLRAATGEYLDELFTDAVEISKYEDLDPAEPPRVLGIDWDTSIPWDGTTLTLTLDSAIDPETLVLRMSELDASDAGTPIAMRIELRQSWTCLGHRRAFLRITPSQALPQRARLRLTIPGSVHGLGSPPGPEQGLTGPAPAAGGRGFILDLHTP